MAKTLKIYHIVCEGSSEVAYLNELNKYMRAFGLGENFHIKTYNLNGVFPDGISSYKHVKKEYDKAVKNKERADEIFVWLDNDVFKRGELLKSKLQKKLNGFSGIKYNYENFEDFLVIHLPDKQVQDWHKICVDNNHFDIPMIGRNVRKLIKSIIFDYSKGSLSQKIQINDESLTRLYENQKNSALKFGSDFIDVIKQLVKIPN